MKVDELGETIVLPTKAIKPCPDNPRTIPARAVEVVAESLKEFGWQQPLVVDTDHVLVAGHTRWRAAQLLKLSMCPVVVARNLTAEQINAYRIVDNRTHDFTSWDYPELVAQLDKLAPDFSDVLGLEDWQGILESFEHQDFGVDLGVDVAADFGGGFAITVIFRDKPTAVAAQKILIDLDGVVDIRHKETSLR